MPSPRQVVAEAVPRVAQLALKSNKSKRWSRRPKSNLPKKKPRKPQRKRSRKLRNQPEKAAEAATNDHAGCMTKNHR